MAGAAILVLNCGSSSIKFAVIDPANGARAVTGLAERVGTPEASLRVRRGADTVTSQPRDGSHRGILGDVIESLADLDLRFDGVGHRVVHGASRFADSVLVDKGVLAEIRSFTELAPLHIPANVAGIEAAFEALPGIPQVAVFDTAFHQSMPPRAYRYAVPADWYEEHQARRYGFHGTSHRYVSERAADLLGHPLADLRLVTTHLGNGCSAAAVRDGISVDTTMGLTPLEGLVMGTRSGDVDPGLLEYMGDRLGVGLREIVRILNTKSGLLGLSGIGNDLRSIEAAAATGSRPAALAIEVFCYRLAKTVAALTVPLERLDALVFTGGIGENSVAVRRSVLDRLRFLGLVEDPEANAAHGRDSGGRISAAGDTLALVVPTDEELVIARDTAALIE